MALAIGAGARTRRSWARGGLGASLLSVFVWLATLFAPGSVSGQPAVEEIVANVRTATAGRPVKMTFRQDVELRVLFFRWTFHADVVQDGSTIDVHMHGAPGFLAPDVTASLLELSEGLGDFDLEFVEQGIADGDAYYVLRGSAKAGHGGAATGGTVRVNGRTWLVDRATLHYAWGNMSVEQSFQTIDGYTVLREQYATVDRMGAKLRVQYGGYSFEQQ